MHKLIDKLEILETLTSATVDSEILIHWHTLRRQKEHDNCIRMT